MAPVAAFTAVPLSGEAPLSVTFDSSASQGDVVIYAWDFGDGDTSGEANPTHVFTDAGDYDVTLTIETLTGSDSVSLTISVAPAWSVDTDGDGLSDGWEEEYFGDLGEDGDGDGDGDGLSNGEEEDLGTDPTQVDTLGPVMSMVSALPTAIRQGTDEEFTVVGLANDVARGNSRVVRGEYFIGSDPGAGNGYSMTASDGAFDTPAEVLSGVVDCSSWSEGSYRIYVRGCDALGHWGSVGSVLVSVVDGVAPSAVRNLSVSPALSFEEITSASWESLGTVDEGAEEKVIDVGSLEDLGALSMEVASPAFLFPLDFTIDASVDGTQWFRQAEVNGFRAARGEYLWLFEGGEYRYVRIRATSRRDRSDGHYYVSVPLIGVWRSVSGNMIKAEWTATADDGSDASSGAATYYDLRYSSVGIDEGVFEACEGVNNEPAPGIKGTSEEAVFSVGLLSGDVYVAVKVGDEVPNWSAISNVAVTNPSTVGLSPLWPEDAYGVSGGAGAIQFGYLRGDDVKPAQIVFSDRRDFPTRPIKNADGTRSMTRRFGLKPRVSYWKASTGQWRSILKLAGVNGTLYWRLEGRMGDYKGVYGPARSIFFDTGSISGLSVSPTHDVSGEEGLWPEAQSAPTFSWTDDSLGMEKFYVDVSTDETLPLSDRKKSTTLGRGKVEGPYYTATAAEWKRLRKLAATSAGTLYWRVRATDAYKALTSASGVKELVIDGGEWTVGALDLQAATPEVSWTHNAQGYLKYSVELSVSEDFPVNVRETVKIPPTGTEALNYAFTPADLSRLATLAQRNSASTLYYRIRAEDSQKQFFTHSYHQSSICP